MISTSASSAFSLLTFFAASKNSWVRRGPTSDERALAQVQPSQLEKKSLSALYLGDELTKKTHRATP
jgi:hypothetical protein